jgi:hypothetical protein
MKRIAMMCGLVACGAGAHASFDAPVGSGDGPMQAGCPMLPANHIFNTRIDGLSVDPHSADYIATIGDTIHVHLDLGTQTNQQAADYYGIPSNLVHAASFAWPSVAYTSTDPNLSWNPLPESDCGDTSRRVLSPCPASPADLPIPATPLVEGGVQTDQSTYGDHHVLILDADSCRLWETYHSYQTSGGTWNIFGSAEFDLRSNALRPAGWTSADAAGFPILPLLLRADEASAGTIAHALRFTIPSDLIRTSYIWPARHLTSNGTGSTTLPPMGQLFRLKASYSIPAGVHAQSRAVLTALQRYGMYIADGGSAMYITGEPSAAWDNATFTEVQSLQAQDFEAVDVTSIMARAGFDANSGAVP